MVKVSDTNQAAVIQIENTIDARYFGKPYHMNGFDRADALIAACKGYEYLILKARNNFRTINDSKIAWSLGLIVKRINSEKATPKSLDMDIEQAIFEDYNIALQYNSVEAAFLSYYNGLFLAKVLNSNKGKERIQFDYENKEIFKWECINNTLITEFRIAKANNLIKTINLIKQEKLELREFYQKVAKAWVDIEFQFPDDYKIYKYTIAQIKEIWSRIYEQAAYIDSANLLRKASNSFSMTELSKLQLQEWNLTTLDNVTAEELLNHLSYTGGRKGKAYSSITTEPIILLPNSDKIICPSMILSHEPERYTVQLLNRLYATENNKNNFYDDSELKEGIFVEDLNLYIRRYPNLKSASHLPIDDTDMDYLLYDCIKKVLVAFEIKWNVEPTTPLEIKTNDDRIMYGVSQIKKYDDYLSKHMNETFQRAFPSEDYLNVRFNTYVITNVSIGSGFANVIPNKIISQRMLKKALNDTRGNLQAVVARFEAGTYIPKMNVHFTEHIRKYDCFGVDLRQTETKIELNGYNLET